MFIDGVAFALMGSALAIGLADWISIRSRNSRRSRCWSDDRDQVNLDRSFFFKLFLEPKSIYGLLSGFWVLLKLGLLVELRLMLPLLRVYKFFRFTIAILDSFPEYPKGKPQLRQLVDCQRPEETGKAIILLLW